MSNYVRGSFEPKIELEPTNEELNMIEADPEADTAEVNGWRNYLNRAGSYQLLTPQQEKDLAATIQSAASSAAEKKAAKDQLVVANLRLVIAIARRYTGLGLDMDDLVQEGNIGLMTAADKFDPDRGFRFSTYACWWIKQAMTRTLANDSRTIRLPVHVAERLLVIKREEKRLLAETGKAPTHAELAAATGYPVETVEEILAAAEKVGSLDVPVGDDGGATVAEFVKSESESPEEVAIKTATVNEVNKAMAAKLNEKERYVLAARFGLDGAEVKTLNEIGIELGITRERVRQLEGKALAKLKKSSSLVDLA